MTELKPCPFCRSKNILNLLDVFTDSYCCVCNNCGSRGEKAYFYDYNKQSDAINKSEEFWNRRHYE